MTRVQRVCETRNQERSLAVLLLQPQGDEAPLGRRAFKVPVTTTTIPVTTTTIPVTTTIPATTTSPVTTITLTNPVTTTSPSPPPLLTTTTTTSPHHQFTTLLCPTVTTNPPSPPPPSPHPLSPPPRHPPCHPPTQSPTPPTTPVPPPHHHPVINTPGTPSPPPPRHHHTPSPPPPPSPPPTTTTTTRHPHQPSHQHPTTPVTHPTTTNPTNPVTNTPTTPVTTSSHHHPRHHHLNQPSHQHPTTQSPTPPPPPSPPPHIAIAGIADHYHLILNNGKIRDVVVKRLRTGQPLTAEARILKKLAGAGGAPLMYGVTNKPSALVMEFCPGLTITKAVLELDRKDLHHVHYAAFLAIRHFHRAGYYHKNLSSDNILVTTTLPFKCHIINVADAKKFTGDRVFDRKMQYQDYGFLDRLKRIIDQR
ncbi:Agglutinin receptor-like [Homarus americanus]|uniref:Agglutinin receptor-like n=1 Tax=Homarus americanus TaxID=6706 RepID=A0A8J5N3D4_HOMAM|nr:Agglutinin receptor-like [Homarus americanus]